jgi:hypothetical protein
MSDGYGGRGGSRNGNSYGGRSGGRNSYGNGRGNGNSYGNGGDRICHFFSQNGTCRNGANCKFSHQTSSSSNLNLNQNNILPPPPAIVKHPLPNGSTNNAVSTTQDNNFTNNNSALKSPVNSKEAIPEDGVSLNLIKSSMKSSAKAEETVPLEEWVNVIRMIWGIHTERPSIKLDNKEYIDDILFGLGFPKDSSRMCVVNLQIINTMLSSTNSIIPKIHAIHTMTSTDCPCTVIDVLSWAYSKWSITKEKGYDIKDTSQIGWASHNVDTIFTFIKQLE